VEWSLASLRDVHAFMLEVGELDTREKIALKEHAVCICGATI
jgi:hypothetical protein